METLWPWIAIAAVGALHGLNPATGWGLATAWSLRAPHRSIPLWALLPMAAGHLASVVLMASAAVWGLTLARPMLLVLAGGLCAAVMSAHLWAHTPRCIRKPARPVGMALWSFGSATAHGAGLALVPALAPLCLGREGAGLMAAAQAPLLWALAALGVHTLAMLAASAAMAATACQGVRMARRWLHGHRPGVSRPSA